MHEKVVFWDIDGTLLSGSLEGGFISYLRQHGQINLWQIITRFAGQMIRVPLPQGYQFKLAYLRRLPVEKVEEWVDSYWTEEVLPRLYPEIRETVSLLYEHDLKQVLLSGTLLPLANRLGEFLGISEIIAARPEIVDGRYTGGLTKPHPAGSRKTKYAKEWLMKHDIDFLDAVALGNHFSDRDLLGRVMVPIAVDPTDRLRAYAGRMGWPVVERPGEVQHLVGAIIRRLQL